MRKDVIQFLNDLPEDPVAQYNEAKQFYFRSPGRNQSIANFHNTQTFSKDRLDQLLYDLKSLHQITNIDLTPAPVKSNSQTSTIEKIAIVLPEFQKGAAGNRERRDWVKANNLEAKSNKNADLDKAIFNFLAQATFKESIAQIEDKVAAGDESYDLEKMKALFADFNVSEEDLKEALVNIAANVEYRLNTDNLLALKASDIEVNEATIVSVFGEDISEEELKDVMEHLNNSELKPELLSEAQLAFVKSFKSSSGSEATEEDDNSSEETKDTTEKTESTEKK